MTLAFERAKDGIDKIKDYFAKNNIYSDRAQHIFLMQYFGENIVNTIY